MSVEGTVIRVANLTRSFGDFTAVDQINFDVRRGEIFGFLGPNGSGKTTTIRMLLGLLPPTQGEVEVLGIAVNKKPQLIRPRVGYMSQRFSLYNDLTVWQNLAFYGRSYGLKNRELSDRIQYAVEMADLQGRENQKSRELSGGWRQRLALGAAILHRPKLIFLDEPTAGVDPLSRRTFWDLLYQLVVDGISVFVTTHYMDEAEHCTRLAFIQRGQIIARGTPRQIKEDTFDGQLFEIGCNDPEKALKILVENAVQLKLDRRTLTLYGALIHAQMHLANDREIRNWQKKIEQTLRTAGLREIEISTIEVSLEDVFINKMKSVSKED